MLQNNKELVVNVSVKTFQLKSCTQAHITVAQLEYVWAENTLAVSHQRTTHLNIGSAWSDYASFLH